MINIGKGAYMTLDEYIKHENALFPDFIKSPLYSCEEEKMLTEEIVAINEIVPGYIKYICNEHNTIFIKKIKFILDKDSVTKNNNPRLYEIITKVVKNMGINMPIVYTYSDSDILTYEETTGEKNVLCPSNAFTLGNRDMLYVFVSDSIINENKLSDEEIMALIGHEIGHAYSNHSIYGNLFQSNVVDLSMIFPIDVIKKITSLYQNNKFNRYNEITADRAGLIASRDLDATISMLKKIHGEEGWEYDHSNKNHPNGKTRVDAIELFSKSLLYYRCIELIDNCSPDKRNFTIMAQELSNKINTMI